MSTYVSRKFRRASVAIFTCSIRDYVDTYLIEVGDVPAFDRKPFLARAIEGVEIRKCVGRPTSFVEVQPAAHLLALPPATTAASVWAFCVNCWAKSPDEIESLAVQALRKLVPHGALDPRGD